MGASGAASSDPADFIPASYDELARHYYGYITGMVRKAGIPDQDVADSVQYILERLEITGAIAQYDPGHLVEHQGRLVTSRFSTFLGAKVRFYCRGLRGRVLRRAGRELLLLDASDKDAGGAQHLTMHEVLLGSSCDDHAGLDAEDFIRETRERLAAVPPRSARDTCDLVALFDELVAEISQTGGFSYAGIQARFGISPTTAGAWLSRLRLVLGGALGRPVATVGGVTLTAEEVAAAVKILREASGPMVAQPLARAGHPLAGAEKGWYHLFAREEIRKFPGVKVPAGTHSKPGGHVKEAVIHRLERILADASAGALVPPPRRPADDEPEPEVTPEEEFEAALWRHITDSAEMDRLKELARQAYAVSAS